MQLLHTFSTLLLAASAIIPSVLAASKLQLAQQDARKVSELIDNLQIRRAEQKKILDKVEANMHAAINKYNEQSAVKLDLDNQYQKAIDWKLRVFNNLKAAEKEEKDKAKLDAKRKGRIAQIAELNDLDDGGKGANDKMKDSDLVNFE